MEQPHPNEMIAPPRAAADPAGSELVRVWAAQGRQCVSINPDSLDDPGIWGLMLVDIARHAVSAYAQQGRFRQPQALKMIKQGFDKEWRRRPPRPLGELIDG